MRGRHPGYSAGSLVRTYRAARAWKPDRDFVRIDWCTVLTARQWLAWFRECLERKTSVSEPDTRKRRWEWQQDVKRLARNLAGRIFTRTSECPVEYRERLAHVLHDRDEI